MKNPVFTLDVAISPTEEIFYTLLSGGWIIALAALLVIGACIGIFIFNHKKNNKKGSRS